MHKGTGKVSEIFLEAGAAARIECPETLIPAPGQYVHAYAIGSNAPLPFALFPSGPIASNPIASGSIASGLSTGGFLAAPPIPAEWIPGTRLILRGPLGKGFRLPRTARRIALIGLDHSPGRLLALIGPAIDQDAAIALASDNAPANLPLAMEIIPLSSLTELLNWADYAAIDLPRDQLPQIATLRLPAETQVLIHTSMPCGALAECGACAITVKRGWKLACKDGPVFDL
jgi:NAD(P)H-flavin reductase